MTAVRPRVVMTLAVLVLAAGALLGSGPASAAPSAATGSCGVLRASGHAWIVVTKGLSCVSGLRAVRALAARTAGLHAGQVTRVSSPLSGYTCLLRNVAKPSGACVKTTAHTVVWLIAA